VRLSKRTEYAIRALVHLARLGPGQYVQSRDVARAEDLPAKFLESVMLGLKRNGYASSKVGAGGGYRLARSARDILLADVIDKLEQNDDTPRSQEDRPGGAALAFIGTRLQAAQRDALAGLTLESLLDHIQQQLKARDAMFYI
jgi:Rrf2 family protein